MNRQERRVADAKSRKTKVQPVTAYHEAGHAVARLLTANIMGYKPEESVGYIEVNPGSLGKSFDGRMLLASQAICMGPMISRPLQRALADAVDLESANSAELIWATLPTLGTVEERRACMYSRMLIDVMGAAAETRFLAGTDPTPLFCSYPCEDDRADFVRNCKVLGLKVEDAFRAETEFLRHSQILVERPIIWSSIDAIATRLTATMSGKRVYQLAWPILEVDHEALGRPLPDYS